MFSLVLIPYPLHVLPSPSPASYPCCQVPLGERHAMANADKQREGECFRLFTKAAFDKLIDFDAPEIQRCNLSSAVLQLVAMNQDPFTFEYIDNPGREASTYFAYG